jgi:hypothetical protein
MSRAHVVALLLVTLSVARPGAPGAEERKPIVAVFELEARGLKLTPTLRGSLTSYLASRLTESGEYEVVPQDRLRLALANKKKDSYKQCYAQSCQIEIGQELAANRALATQLMKVGTHCIVTCNLFDLRRATSGRAATAKGPCSEDGISASLDAVVAKLARAARGAAPAAPAAPAASQTAGGAAPSARGKGWLGVKLAKHVGGVRVVWVGKGTPGERAGLRTDDVVTRLGDQVVTSPAEAVAWATAQAPGSSAPLEVRRRAQALRLTIVIGDLARAADTYAKACGDGDGGACEIAGVAHSSARPARAAALWRRGCELADMNSCSGLCVLHMRGAGVGLDYARALALCTRACDGGSMNGCANLSTIYASGLGVTIDLPRALALARKACDAREAAGCRNLATYYERGKGVPADRARAKELYRKACELGHAGSCPLAR